MRCEEVRARLQPDALELDPELETHMAGCAACFAALEAADPVARMLRAARPPEAAAPARMAAMVLARWQPQRASRRARLAGLAAAAVIAVALAIEVLVGAEPAHVTVLIGTMGSSWIAPGAGVVATFSAVRAIALDLPGLLVGLSLATVAACGLWARVVLALPTWRSAT